MGTVSNVALDMLAYAIKVMWLANILDVLFLLELEFLCSNNAQLNKDQNENANARAYSGA